MVFMSPSHQKPLHSLQLSSLKFPSSSPNFLSLMKLKTLIHSLVFSHVCRIIRALSKATSFLVDIVRNTVQPTAQCFIYYTKRNKKHQIYFGSFRLHYNWCSSRSFRVPESILGGFKGNGSAYYAPISVFSSRESEDHKNGESQLSRYLQWLEDQEGHEQRATADDKKYKVNEIDQLADLFIAKCHEKFILEKQESDRRFQEMLARSV